MNNTELINDTLKRIKKDLRLSALTKAAIKNTEIISKGFFSQNRPSYPDSRIFFEENLTLLSAYRYADAGSRTAVLSFANPIEPGGGVLCGAPAQEEYLCRASNLYPCLASDKVSKYYELHNKMLGNSRSVTMFLGTDTVIYSRGVTFFREDYNYIPNAECNPEQVYSENWRTIDVITCAAPLFLGPKRDLPDDELRCLLRRRIKNILEVAIEHNIETLILGAFGCGAFNNPPSIAAVAFQSVFSEERYRYAFKNVVFSVKRTNCLCKNIEAFETAFRDFPHT